MFDCVVEAIRQDLRRVAIFLAVCFAIGFLSVWCVRKAGAADGPPIVAEGPPQVRAALALASAAQATAAPKSVAPQAKTSRAACATCDCAVTGECTCPPAVGCQCGLQAKKDYRPSYERQYYRALAEGRTLIVWVGNAASCERDCPEYLHAYESNFQGVESPSVVVAKVENGKLIEVDTLVGVPTCGAIRGSLAQHERRRQQFSQGQVFTGFRGNCGPGG